MAAGADVGIDPEHRLLTFAQIGADAREQVELAFRLDIDLVDARFNRETQFALALADA